MKKITLIFLMISSIFTYAQDDLLSVLDLKASNFITSTFKGKRIVNGQSVELTSTGVLQFQIQHRFGTLNSGFYNLFGLDNSQIRIGLDYGVKEWLSVGIGRSSALKTIDTSVKFRLKRQSTGEESFPFTIVCNSATFVRQYRWTDLEAEIFEFSNQLSYAHQLLIARKINSDLSVQISPTLVHYNLVNYGQQNDRASIGFGARQRLSNRVSVNAEYFLQATGKINQDVLSLGFDIETGGHVFQLHLSNSPAMITPVFIHETTSNWANGDIYFGFNISRVFSINEKQ
ncbi:MAG: DUF5777 family beta-barrel protein [Bacteroidota bacterium]|nr:DUF5777 family beta-barrel protein [Bacteroidota bacterium]